MASGACRVARRGTDGVSRASGGARVDPRGGRGAGDVPGRDFGDPGLGTSVLAIGRARVRGKGSGVETDSAFCVLADSKGTTGKDTRTIRLRTYLDLNEGLEAAGLRE